MPCRSPCAPSSSGAERPEAPGRRRSGVERSKVRIPRQAKGITVIITLGATWELASVSHWGGGDLQSSWSSARFNWRPEQSEGGHRARRRDVRADRAGDYRPHPPGRTAINESLLENTLYGCRGRRRCNQRRLWVVVQVGDILQLNPVNSPGK